MSIVYIITYFFMGKLYSSYNFFDIYLYEAIQLVTLIHLDLEFSYSLIIYFCVLNEAFILVNVINWF